MTLSKTPESEYAHAIRDRIFDLIEVRMSMRIVRAAIAAVTELPPPPVAVDPWEKYKDMKGSGQ